MILTDRGHIDLEQAIKVSSLFDPLNPCASFITNAEKAKELFKLDTISANCRRIRRKSDARASME